MAVGSVSAASGVHYIYGQPLEKASVKQVLTKLARLGMVLSLLLVTIGPALLKANSMVRASYDYNEYFAPTAAVQAEAVHSVEMTENAALDQTLTNWVNQHQGSKWGIAVEDLSSNEVAGANAYQSFRSASIYKLYLMYPLMQKVPLEKFAATEIQVNGQSRSLEECVNLMLRVSDNDCAEAIGNFVGWAQADRLIHTAGFTGTQINDFAPRTTAHDTSRYLAALYQGKLVDRTESNYIFSILKQQRFRDGIPKSCPSNCLVMNKTGDIPGVLNDVAVIEIGGKVYAVSIFSENGQYGEIGDVTRVILGTR